MSKIKMRCITCGKWFQSANAKEVTCPDCVQKARKEKMVSKTAPPNTSTGPGATAAPRPVAPPPKPKSTQGGTNQWLDSLEDVKVAQPDQPPPRPKFPPSPVSRDTHSTFSGRIPTDPREERGDKGDRERGPAPGAPGNFREARGEQAERSPGNYREERGERGPAGYGNYREGRGPGAYRENDYRGPGAYRVSGGSGLSGTLGQRPRQPMEGGFGQRPRPEGDNRLDRPRSGPGAPRGGKPGAPKAKKPAKPAAPPKPKREKIPPPEPFKPTPEQVTLVEERYIELAVPSEFDGIRTQISKELTIPKKAVKTIIKELRARQDIPSWWELQVYKGSAEELESIKKAYEPYLPVPPVGVHKNIAETLSLKPGTVYQAIKTVRQEMHLPQYNDPALHGLELKQAKQNGSSPEQPSEEKAQSAESQPIAARTAETSPAQEQVAAPVVAEAGIQEIAQETDAPATITVSEGGIEKLEPENAAKASEEIAPLEA